MRYVVLAGSSRLIGHKQNSLSVLTIANLLSTAGDEFPFSEIRSYGFHPRMADLDTGNEAATDYKGAFSLPCFVRGVKGGELRGAGIDQKDALWEFGTGALVVLCRFS